MPGELSIKSLLENFQSSSREDWMRVANSETGISNAFDKLTWQGTNELSFAPYYDQDDLSVHRVPDAFQLTPSAEKFLGPRSWINLPPIVVGDEAAANREALIHLQQGADGILFICSGKTNFAKLLNSIQTDYCQLSFQLENKIPVEDLLEYLKDQSTSSIQGNFFWEKKILEPEQIVSASGLPKKISSLGIFVPFDPDPAKEILETLCEGVRLLDLLTENGYSAKEALFHISFSFDNGRDFFFTYAKIKVMRSLWFQVARAYNESSFRVQDTVIHARSEAWRDEHYNPHSAMLHATTSAVSAICGGCNALTIYPDDPHNQMMSRVARNVSNILREEAYMNAVADPLAGSYFADTLVSRLARLVWEKFQQRMNNK